MSEHEHVATGWDEVAQALREMAARDRFSGVVVVEGPDGPWLRLALGTADHAAGRPVTFADRFGTASVSKMLTAAAVLDASVAGLLDLDDLVTDLLPAARRPRTLDPRVTVRHLLTHTSGIGDYAEEDDTLDGYVPDYAALWRTTPSVTMERPDDFLPLYADLPAVAEPGEGFHYCNSGYVLLAALLEEVTGDRFTDRVTERVLRPTGMTSSGYLRLDEAHPDVATGYLPRRRDASWRSNVLSVPVVGGGDGGCLLTADDATRFARALGDGTLLGGEVARLMRTVGPRIDVDASMGHGVYVLEDGALGHDGGDPGVEAYVRYDVPTDATVVILCNGEGMLDGAWRAVRAALRG
ncbi:serine hydrolase [Sanguibacter sp. HDW7]|uniref:serine hydrolase domain-containing protein n=1 Tax=Sanguibacter sp. HDW7 TaxID=2714931 RepID=UPI00140E04B8|nr:serine hydrolase domain-containing protein [Sanguibacter sp. HDW7]QIK84085.1 beta-lactamase family protein [Sanguibacter sp. HDW7]